MINTEEFTKRLQKVIDFYNESASSFAEKIGVQRSSISHILSGRNKPSLDFVMKVLDTYPEVELYWLLNGKGTFPYHPNTPQAPIPKTQEPITPATPNLKLPPEIHKQETETRHNEPTPNYNQNLGLDSEIEKIVIFYNNGTFKSYKP
ncbi:helix-turn-helix domain-containing protein [Winogradskyella wichelsiae]|uniref:helix-turn-helix domain-containing protein n=1 Tax=Winogradskyella wichelsiae TaxID=2697007 RepID=UPI0015CD142B|nr:helix-turn-helix transcriptional regulator [Winogradskyella wichelsiae]